MHTSRTCHASVDTSRAVIALLFPVASIIASVVAFQSKGYDPADYLILLRSGELSWFRQGLGWLCLIGWVWRYFPPAWLALWDGPCIVSSDEYTLFLPSSIKVRLVDVIGITLCRDFFRKEAVVETSNGRFAFSLIFVSESSDSQLKALDTCGRV
jgi:hypothetical protein